MAKRSKAYEAAAAKIDAEKFYAPFEAVTLAQTQKVTQFPVVLMGTAYWKGLLDWLRGSVLQAGMIGEDDIDRLVVTDLPEEAVAAIQAHQDRPNGTIRAERPE